MNALINNGLKVLACGAAAVVITAIGSVVFLQDTAVVHQASYTTPAPWVAKLSVEPAHAWFGQPEPAVLVD